MHELHDMHCHLDFIEGAEALAAEAGRVNTMIFANTVTPAGWLEAQERFGGFANVQVGFGMHPWWAAGEPEEPGNEDREGSQRASRRREAQAAEERRDLTETESSRIAETMKLLDAGDPIFIGEVGLDFGWRHQRTRMVQESMFESIAAWAGQRGGKLLSIHSIKSAQQVIDILDRTGALSTCACVFHWYSGPSDLLKRAIDAGCYFSCGFRMLDTKKGREYVKAIPVDRILLETDAPPERNTPYPYAELRRDLERAAEAVAAIKGPKALQSIAETTRTLLTPTPLIRSDELGRQIVAEK